MKIPKISTIFMIGLIPVVSSVAYAHTESFQKSAFFKTVAGFSLGITVDACLFFGICIGLCIKYKLSKK